MKLTCLFVFAVLFGVALNTKLKFNEEVTIDCNSPASSSSITFDFECGCLSGWTVSGGAFKFQPTLGDNVRARDPNQRSGHEGNYWIGSYENYTSKAGTPGAAVGEGQQGYMLSDPFKIFSNKITFLMSGGSSVNLCIELRRYQGYGLIKHAMNQVDGNTMKRITWDVRNQIGTWAYFVVKDYESGQWGHISFDDFRFVA